MLIKTKSKCKTLRFRETNTDEIKKVYRKLNPKKASQKFHMSTNIFSPSTSAMINGLICSSKFQNE